MQLPNWLPEDRGYDTPCHVWQGYVTDEGYAYWFRGRARTKLAHRSLYEDSIGHQLPPSVKLHHRCEVKSCVRLDHLTETTNVEHQTLHRGQPRPAPRNGEPRAPYRARLAARAAGRQP